MPSMPSLMEDRPAPPHGACADTPTAWGGQTGSSHARGQGAPLAEGQYY